MSERMIHRLDVVTAWARWLALVGVPVVAFMVPLSDLALPERVTFLFVALGMAVVDAVPVLMLMFKFYPESVALGFLIVDVFFAIAMLYLGGPGMLFYAAIPAIAVGVRFDWLFGLGTSIILTLAHIFIVLIHAHFQNVELLLPPALLSGLALVLASVVSSLLADGIKREPPLNDKEQKALQEKLRRLQAAADRARAIYEMAGTLSATLNYDKILDSVLEISSMGFSELADKASDYQVRSAGAVFLYGEGGLFVAAARNVSYEEMDLILNGQRGVLYQVLQEGESLILGNLARDPELGQFTVFRRCRAAICVPLRAGFESYGAVIFASPVPNVFSKEHIELLQAVSNQATVALTNAQLYQDLQEEKERVIAVQEEARTKLSRDLHDGPTQSISAIAMRLNFARLLLERDPIKVKDELFKLENLARRTTKEIRTMLFTLRPVVLETQGLKVAVEQLVDKIRETTETGQFPVTFELEDIEDQIDVNIKAVAWFITQEALNNAKKYAEAEHIWVRMYVRNTYFVTEIQDDGKGFDFDATMASYEQRGSFGLLNLQERADLVNGRTIIRSELGKGTKVTLTVPLNRETI